MASKTRHRATGSGQHQNVRFSSWASRPLGWRGATPDGRLYAVVGDDLDIQYVARFRIEGRAGRLAGE
jgi:hypothetical protein